MEDEIKVTVKVAPFESSKTTYVERTETRPKIMIPQSPIISPAPIIDRPDPIVIYKYPFIKDYSWSEEVFFPC